LAVALPGAEGYFFGPPFSLGLLLPGAWAGLPDGNCPGGKFAADGAMRGSSWLILNCRFAVAGDCLRGSLIVYLPFASLGDAREIRLDRLPLYPCVTGRDA